MKLPVIITLLVVTSFMPAEAISLDSILEDVSEIQSATEYVRGAAGLYPNLPAGVIDILRPGSLPYDIFFSAFSLLPIQGLNVTLPNPTSTPPTLQSVGLSFAAWLAAIIVFWLIGMLLAILFPVCCCCFLCCRCCGKCGAKGHYYRKANESTKCAVLAALLLTATLIAMIGPIFLLLGNQKVNEAVESAPGTVSSAFTDLTNFVNDTVKAIENIAVTQFGNVADGIVNDIQGVGNTIGAALGAALTPVSTPLIANGTELAQLVDATSNVLGNINETSESLKEQYNQLTALLDTVRADLQQLQTNCSTSTVSALCAMSLPTPNSFSTPVNFSTLPDISSQLTSIDNVDDLDISGRIDMVNQTINNLGPFVSNFTASFTGGIDGQVNQIKGTVGNLVQTVTNITNPLFSETGTVSQIRNQIDNVIGNTGPINTAEQARYGVLIAASVVIILLMVLVILGLLCGVAGYSKMALPADRSGVSNAASKVLMICVIIFFILGGLMMLFSAILFLFAAPTQKICNSLQAPEYNLFSQVIDNGAAWGGSTLINSLVPLNLNLNITALLTDCANNGTLWQVMQLQNLFNITGLLGNINLGQQFSNISALASLIDLSSISVFPPELQQGLQAFNNTALSISNIDFNGFNQQLNMSIINFDLNGAIQNLTSLTTAFQMANEPGLANLTEYIIGNLTEINSTVVPTMEAGMSSLSSNLSEIQMLGDQIQPAVSSVLSNINDVTNFFGSSAATDAITTSLNSTVTGALNSVTQFINQLPGILMNDIAKCRPIWAVYTSFYILVCNASLDGLNGLWFALGWSSLFLIPVIIFAAWLIPYYKRLDDPIEILTDNYPEASNAAGYSNIHALRTISSTHQASNEQYPPRSVPVAW